MKGRILVTGGTGYIGSHTAVELINAGYDVIIVDNLSNSFLSVLDGIEKITGVRPEFVKLDLTDKNLTRSFFENHQDICSIIHFAAYKAVGESVKNPIKYYSNNIISLINILDCMKEFKIHDLVFSSSCTVYGQPDILPVTEETPFKPADSPYGNTKQISEEIIRETIAASENINAVSLRYFNPIGAHQSGLIGELPLGVPENLIPYVTQTAIGIREEVRVFGVDYNTPDGSAIRDYINVNDLAKAHIVSVERLIKKYNKKPYEYFNLGTGTGVSVLQIINGFEEATGVKLNCRLTTRRPGDIEKIWADTTLANTELGWSAETSLHDTLLSAWEWEKYYRNNQSK